MIAATLTELNTWFNEPGLSLDRTNLLSKLATLELCGWLEGEFDRLVRLVAQGRIVNASWVETEVIKKTHGFKYEQHWRPMLCKVVGEMFACKVESAMDAAHPGDVPQMNSILNQLWITRCSFAHADLHANRSSQLTFNAPSIAINHFNQLSSILTRYEAILIATMPNP